VCKSVRVECVGDKEPKEPKVITSAIPGPKSKALWEATNQLQDPHSTHFFAGYSYMKGCERECGVWVWRCVVGVRVTKNTFSIRS
jgi:hypothetical protein